MVCLIRRPSEKLTACLTPTSEISMSLLARCLLQRALCELIGRGPCMWCAVMGGRFRQRSCRNDRKRVKSKEYQVIEALRNG